MAPMKSMVTIILAAVACTVSAGDGWASPSHLEGAGAKTCATFVQRAGPDGLSDPTSLQWVLGYLTGRAVATTNAWHRPFTGPEGIARDTLAYCRAHPVRQIDDAAASFFERTRRCRAMRGCR